MNRVDACDTSRKSVFGLILDEKTFLPLWLQNRLVLLFVMILLFTLNSLGQGSRILAPNYPGPAALGVPGPANDDFAWLEHDVFENVDFLDPAAPAEERLFVYLRQGETLRYGIRRIPIRQQAGVAYSAATIFGTNQDLSILIRENDGTIAQATYFDTDAASDGDATLLTSNGGGTAGIIQNVAESLLGPEFTFNSTTFNTGGYTPIEYTNNTGSDQAFYISFLQDNYTFTTEAQLITDVNAATIADVNVRSNYDLWDFTVYDGSLEKTGRLFCRRWKFSAQYFDNLLADEMELFIRVPSTVGGASAGNYIKKVDLGGLDPLSLVVYANSVGSDGTGGDLNGDGVTDFQDNRQSQTTDNGAEEYDIFLQNPDIDVWPTTTLPTITITEAQFFCNSTGAGGAATITFTTDQVGFVAILIDLDGTTGYQAGTEDVIVEAEITSEGSITIDWDGLNGLGAPVPSGTSLSISGRFTAGPIHVPMFDVEESESGISMLDVRPSTSFDLIYWDDTNLANIGQNTGADPTAELDGTNLTPHLWNETGGNNGGEGNLVNTWSFGFYQINSQNLTFTFNCDNDGDEPVAANDLDSDNDGIANSVEGDPFTDTDGDGIGDYLDSDVAGFVDSNADGVNDNFDADLDGIPNAFDVDSDNDGIPDLLENGLTDADLDGTLDEGSGITDVNLNGLDDTYDPACDGTVDNFTGNAVAVVSVTNLSSQFTANPDGSGALGVPEGTLTGNTLALFEDVGNQGIWDMGVLIPSGETIVVTFLSTNLGNVISIAESSDGTTFSNVQTFSNAVVTTIETLNFVLAANARYLRVEMTTDAGGVSGVDGFAYNFNVTCTGGAALTLVDTDGDGVNDYLDIDSDDDGIVDVIEAGGTADASTGKISGFTDSNNNGLNDAQESVALARPDTDADGSLLDYQDIDADNDGIPDNEEAQTSSAFIASAAGDTNGNGLLDVYDPTNGGTFLPTVDTDSDGTEDYISTDSDGDGVADIIEGHDANFNGFGDWDSNSNNILETADFAGFDSDGDGDGLWNVFDTDNGGTAAPTQNTDGADNDDWQDTDDDNDGILTSGEDTNTNNDFTDDKTQGQGGSADTPDYLYRGDYDGDAIADASDLDSDNDGILDADEDNGIAIDPSQDSDSDGIPNYRDNDIDGDGTVNSADSDTGGVNTTSFTDANGDGTIDQYDSDLDGVPDFLDLDSDNDGIWDAVEANEGAVPFGLSTTTGQFTLQDPDNDGIMNFVDTDDVSAGGTSDLTNPDTDADGLNDYRDIDSDADGIPDIVEAQTTAAFIDLANLDTDGDGIDNNFDPDNGGTQITPVNSEGLDTQDYIDTDSDNDNVPDLIEGDDANFDGVTDATVASADADGDGLDDGFDTVTLGTAGNATGSSADRQNTDGIDFRDWRDNNDDNDSALTADEDANSNGNYADDQTQGQSGSVPDYLFNGDRDSDGISDLTDLDADNDGILDTDEAGGESIAPDQDADGDGIPNYRDTDDATVLAGIVEVDSNADGVWDNYDQDLDGIPDFLDVDSDNDGVPDLTEANGTDGDGDGVDDSMNDDDSDGIPNSVDVSSTGGVDSDGDGIDDAFDFSIAGGTDTDGDDIIDSADPDIDGDGLANTFDTDNGGTALVFTDSDSDGLNDQYDLDSDNDGITDLVEYGGTDSDGDGKLDDLTDTDLDGFADLSDTDNGGTVLTRPDSDNDGVRDYLDVDSDNDGVPDPVDNGGPDTNNDGRVDGFSSDADGDGLADVVDPDSGGTPISNSDIDGDGLGDYQDLDADNDGYPDILEAGGTDSDNDGIVNNTADTDDDGIPDNVDVDQSGTNGGSGVDSDGDGIDNSFDVTSTGGADTDGDSIDDTFDSDRDGDGFDDDAEANPYGQEDKEGDGNKDFRDIDSDGDGIVDVVEFGQTADAATGTISGYTDANSNGWNDAQESTPITPTNSDLDSFPDFQDIDSDDDGLPDLIEAQTNATFTAISDTDTDNDGLDDAFDPNNGGTLITPVNTDATGSADYIDTDSDDDNVPDVVEGDNDDKSQFGDWDTDSDNDPTDETGYNTDSDSDGLRDLFDIVASSTSSNVSGSNSDGQDSDADGTWDFQDTDDDGDGLLTSAEDTNTADGDPTNEFGAGGTPIPDYLFGVQDSDGDGQDDDVDLDSDNDGILDTDEAGGIAINPSGDIDGDGLPNYQDNDIDGDGTQNSADTDGDGSGTNTTSFTDTNSDGVIDQFDFDLDGIPDFLDLDSDDDGILDGIEANGGTIATGFTIATGIFSTADADNDGLSDDVDGGTTSTLSNPDTDSDGINDFLDIDSDNDGIVDNVEAQATGSYIAPAAGDTDADGILDVYDGNNSGTAITPENTDGADNVDYRDTDTDNDTVLDNIEAFDANSDGFASWDTDGDNDITDEAGSGFNVDTDGDGLWLIFDNSSGRGTIANITGSNNNRQDTDGDGAEDWRDNNDDNDLSLTSAEDANTNSNFADDFTQGGGATPDYLFNPDVDGDNVTDSSDDDSDNDGVLNTDEYAGTTYAVGSDVSGNAGTPFGDSDGDGIFNYLDDNDVNFTITDVNGDNVDDRVDQDRDGVPNFFDLDSDNDGILDAIEANSGVAPSIGSFSTSTGRFSGTDGDSDGIVDAVESAPLAKPDFDSDGFDDYLDLDTDNDGITDNVEGQTTAARVDPSDSDTDGDGWDNSYDPDNGGTTFVPTNTDGTFTISDTEPDYRDIDSDNDNDGIGFVGDQIEGFDANRNGFSELDSDLDLDLSDETGHNVDTDNDGLWDLYDNFSGRGVNNINGSSANLQDTDGDGTLDFRDQDDDEDNISTAVEDVDSDGNWTNDKFQGGGATPDYLFFNDSDRDRVADGQDADGDNDGISDTDEYDNTVYRNPFGDQDGDGVFNYNDPDNPNALDGTTALTDSNSDGIWDEYDTDLDGVPNFFDLDSDNDGIPDIVEAGGTDSNNDGILDGIEDSDDDGIPDNVDVDSAPGNGGSGVDTDGDDIDDTFDADQTAGTDADGDSILDTFDFDDDGDGIINIIDADEGGAALADGDFDGDGLQNRIDLDSDSDGITDLIEGRGSDTDGNGVLDTTGDTDGDGWGNLHDPTNGGTPLALPDTDTDGSADYLDIDADADGVFDYNEGFDDDEDDTFTDDYTDRATAFGNASFYDPLDLFWYNLDSDTDNTPDFLDPDSPRFADTDNDGIIDLFDTDNGGNFYGNVAGKPDNDADGTENYIDLDGGFTVSTFSVTTGEDGTNDSFTVVLTQQPTSNVVINVSETSDEVSLSTSTLTFTNADWNMAQTVTVNGEDDALNDGDIGFSVLVSVSAALSDDNFDNASNQTVNGTNLDNEGSIRVSTNTANTAENGTTVDFTVELSVAPTTNVVIDVTEASDEGALSGATLVGGQLTFTNANWNVAQTVTITPADDNLLDGAQVYNITASVNDPLSDDGFDAAADETIVVTNADDDVGFILSSTSVTTNEDGTTDQFTVVLDVQPGSGQVVVIDLTETSDEGSVGPTQLTFDEFNWNIAQTVTVTPVDDTDLDGNQVYNITLAINDLSTTDNSFDALADQTVSVTNQDDDTLPLPLDLLSFDAEFIDGSVWLDWVTANERNVDYMAVERSFDGITYEQIGRVSPNNTETEVHEYAFEDERPFEGFNYYRLNTVDYDGSYELSNVVIVMATAREFEIKAYPNPVVERLNISSTLSLGSMTYSVYDIRGKLVNYGRFDENEFETSIDLSRLPTGIYHVIINSPTVTENIRIKKVSNNP